MIPKIIHYCWFGGNPMPESAIKCIESWKKFLPDYEIKEWNESNFDVNIIPYTSEAYKAKKYAFVSDYARFWILYNYGGLYFDTDVEVIKNMDDIIAKGPFMGCENEASDTSVASVAPGLGLYKELLSMYDEKHFITDEGKQIRGTIVDYTTELFVRKGLVASNDIQLIENVWIYPKEYFCPKDYKSGKMNITERSVSIHHYDSSWVNKSDKLKKKIISIIGPSLTNIIVRIKQFFA